MSRPTTPPSATTWRTTWAPQASNWRATDRSSTGRSTIPFGDTSFGAFAKKRYRYVGKEKDGESGLYYYGARYYAPWICRFVSVDPLAHDYPYLTPYNYAGNKPIGDLDIDGMQGTGDSPHVSTGDKVPNAPQHGDVFITGVDHQFMDPSGTMISGTDGSGPSVFLSTPLKTFMYGYVKGDNMQTGSWVTLGFETEGGSVFTWDSDKLNFTNNSTGEEFDDHVSFDATRVVQNMVTPMASMAIAWEKQGDPFVEVKSQIAAHGGGLMSFAWDSAKQGVHGFFSDLAAGGRRRSDALWGLTLGGSAPGFGAGMGISSKFRRFYSVLGDGDFNRLKGGGAPWPTAPSKAHLGAGVYSWGDFQTAAAYRADYEAKGILGLSIRQLDITDSKFKGLLKLDLYSLDATGAENWIASHSSLYGAGLPHGFDYIKGMTSRFGAEHYFSSGSFKYFRIR
ncbi:MAG: RHS repeat-associated core domain-containing protein [Flavobacteriales bacterium]|nr:RHS repeat-associated core domain-containing protein [Flavobacteriales bacterium]